MTATVTIGEVNQNTSQIFRRVGAGESLIVSKSGHTIARIVPYKPEDAYERLVAEGRIIPAPGRGEHITVERVPGLTWEDVEAAVEWSRADKDFGQ